MEFNIIVHGDFKKRFTDKGMKIPLGVGHIREKGVGISDWERYQILCDIFNNAKNISFISEYAAPLSMIELLQGEEDIKRYYKTKKGYDIYVSFTQDVTSCTSCTCQSYSKDFIDELIQAVNEYYNVEFSYYEITIRGYEEEPIMIISLYENEKARASEDSRILLVDSETKYFVSDKNKIYATSSTQDCLLECKYTLQKNIYWSKVFFEKVDLEKCREVSADMVIDMINTQIE